MNPVVHFEIPAEDMQRAEKFYREVFGWQMNKMMDDYIIATTIDSDENGPTKPGGINGAIAKKSDTYQHPDIVIEVPSLEDYLEKVKTYDCEVVTEPTAVAEMGRFAMFKDTEGNMTGLWQTVKKSN